jgi:hypothetical protein
MREPMHEQGVAGPGASGTAAGEVPEPLPLRRRMRRGLRGLRHGLSAHLDTLRYRVQGTAFDPSVATTPFLVTGPPRSGTSLMTSLLNRTPNVIVVNEPIEMSERRLRHVDPALHVRGYLAAVQRRAVRRGVVVNKADPENPDRPATDTWYQSWRLRAIPVTVDPSRRLCVGAKQPMPFLDRLEMLCDAWPELRAVVVLRDPFATLSSWQRTFHSLRDISDDSFVGQFRVYRQVPPGGTPLERQARLLRAMIEEAERRAGREQVLLVSHEGLLAEPAAVLRAVLRHIRASDPDAVPDVSDLRREPRPAREAFEPAARAVIERELAGLLGTGS